MGPRFTKTDDRIPNASSCTRLLTPSFSSYWFLSLELRGRNIFPSFFLNDPANQSHVGPSCDEPLTNLKVTVGFKASNGNHGRCCGSSRDRAGGDGSTRWLQARTTRRPSRGRGAMAASARYPAAWPRPGRRRLGGSITAIARHPAAKITASARHPAAQPRPGRRRRACRLGKSRLPVTLQVEIEAPE